MTNPLAKLWQKLNLGTKTQLRIMRVFNDEFLIGVTGVVLDDKNKVLLVKHTYRDGDAWSLPGGYIKKGEHPKEGLEREIKEETGLTVSVDERMKIRTDRQTARLDITYKGVFIGGEFQPSKEVTEANFFSFNNLPILTKDQLKFIDEAINKSQKHK